MSRVICIEGSSAVVTKVAVDGKSTSFSDGHMLKSSCGGWDKDRNIHCYTCPKFSQPERKILNIDFGRRL